MKPRSSITGTLLLTFVALTSSCAAMFTGTTSDVHFTSEPSGAVVTAGDQTGKTPCTLTIKKKEQSGTIRYEGQPEMELDLARGFQGGFLLMDILFTPGYGLVGILIDGGTGAWYKHPATIHHDMGTGLAALGRTREDEPREASANVGGMP